MRTEKEDNSFNGKKHGLNNASNKLKIIFQI